MPDPLRLLIADNSTMTFLGLPPVLDANHYVMLSPQVVSLRQAQEECRQQRPDVLLLALNLIRPLPDIAVVHFRRQYPAMRLILIDDDDGDGEGCHHFLKIGVVGYLRRSDPVAMWQACFQTIACGGVFLNQNQCVQSSASPVGGTNDTNLNLDAFSEREIGLFRLLLSGCTNKEIATQMNLSDSTVRNNLSDLYKKLGVKTRAAVLSQFLSVDLGDEGEDEA